MKSRPLFKAQFQTGFAEPRPEEAVLTLWLRRASSQSHKAPTGRDGIIAAALACTFDPRTPCCQWDIRKLRFPRGDF